MQIPVIESTCVHNGGDLTKVAAWLLDCLDRQPPPFGGWLIIYLCCHPDDNSYFNSPRRYADLTHALLGSYQQELGWDAFGFGDLRFDLTAAAPPAHLALTLRNRPSHVRGRRKPGHLPTTNALESTLIEFVWHITSLQGTPGMLGMVRRHVRPLAPSSRIAASLEIISGAQISRHRELWQNSVRWYQPVIYLPEGVTELTVGAYAGSDLYAPMLSSPFIIDFDSHNNEWHWRTPVLRFRRSKQGQQAQKMELNWRSEAGQTIVALRGASLPAARTLEEQEKENRLPSFTLEITGCLLPFSQGNKGYGVVPDTLPKVLTAHVRTALALPGNDGWLYFDEQTQKIYLLQKGDAPPGRPLDESQTTLPLKYIFGAGAKAPVSMRWKKPDGVLSHSFHVELMLTPPLVARLACGDISENLPDDVFVGYKDSAHGRAPVRLVSDDGRQYQLIFNPSAKHPVYLLTDANPTGMIYKAEPSKAINLGSEAEFVIGTTHYRLRSTETGANAESLNPQPS